jgi:hypothetical protein
MEEQSHPPAGQFVVFSSHVAAQKFQSAVNRALGIPQQSYYAGGGRHAPMREYGWNPTYANLLVHPSGKLWAHTVNDEIRKLLRSGVVPPSRRRPATLAADWAGAQPILLATRPEGGILKAFLSTATRLPRHAAAARIIETGTILSAELRQLLGEDPEAFCRLSDREFEFAVAEILLAQRCAVFVGPGSRDGGVDVVAASVRDILPSILLVQCKRQAAPVGESVVKGLLADIQRFNATAGLIATTSRFTQPARVLAAEHLWRIQLWSCENVFTHYRAHIIEGHL